MHRAADVVDCPKSRTRTWGNRAAGLTYSGGTDERPGRRAKRFPALRVDLHTEAALRARLDEGEAGNPPRAPPRATTDHGLESRPHRISDRSRLPHHRARAGASRSARAR